MPGADLAARGRDRLRTPAGAAAAGLAVVIAVGVLMRLYRFGSPILDSHGFRQTQTASEVWLWDRFGFDLFDYRVPMFGAGHWVLEFPAYQTLVWGLSHTGLGIEAAGRIVSIASYAGAAVLVYVLGARGLGSRAAGLASAAVFSLLPVTVFYYRAVMIDPFLIFLILLATLLVGRLQARFTWPCFAGLSAVFLVALLGKPTLMMALGGPLFVIGVRILLDRGVPAAQRLALVGTAVGSGIILLIWNHHGEVLNKASDSDWVSGNRGWYFGTTFTSTKLWSTVFERFQDNLQLLGTALAILGLVLIPTVRTGRRPELVALVAGGLLSIAVFANLNTIHDYYQLPYYVTLSLLVGLAIAWLHGLVGPRLPRVATPAAVALVVALGWIWSQNLYDGYFGPGTISEGFRGQAIELANATPPGGRILLMQENADRFEPIVWYEARRAGWRVRTTHRAEATRIARGTPDLAGIVFLRGPSPEPVYISKLAFARGFARTFESPAMVVYTAPR